MFNLYNVLSRKGKTLFTKSFFVTRVVGIFQKCAPSSKLMPINSAGISASRLTLLRNGIINHYFYVHCYQINIYIINSIKCSNVNIKCRLKNDEFILVLILDVTYFQSKILIISFFLCKWYISNFISFRFID